MMIGVLCLVGVNKAMASDYWVYSEIVHGTKYDYYVAEETIEAVKGAYHIDVKEVPCNGKPYRFKFGVMQGYKGIMYYNVGKGRIEPHTSNGHDLAYAIWE